MGWLALLLGATASLGITLASLRRPTLTQCLAASAAVYVSLLAVFGYTFDVLGAPQSLFNFIIVFLIISVGCAVMLVRRRVNIDAGASDFILGVIVVFGALAVCLAFAYPSLLPLGPGGDAARHFGLVNFIVNAHHVPAVTSTHPLRSYSPGFHLSAAFFSSATHVAPFFLIHSYLSVIFSATILTLFAFATRAGRRLRAIVIVLLTVAAPWMLGFPLLLGYWPQIMAVLLLAAFVACDRSASESGLRTLPLLVLIESALIISYPLFAVLLLPYSGLRLLEPSVSRRKKLIRFTTLTAAWLLVGGIFAVRSSFFSSIMSFNRFATFAALGVALLAAAGTGAWLAYRVFRPRLLAWAKRFVDVPDTVGSAVRLTRQLAPSVIGYSVCVVATAWTASNFIPFICGAPVNFDADGNLTLASHLVNLSLWIIVALATAGLLTYLPRPREHNGWYYFYVAVSATVIAVPFATLLGFAQPTLLAYFSVKFGFVLFLPVVYFAADGCAAAAKRLSSLAAESRAGKTLTQASDYLSIAAPLLIVATVFVIAVQGYVTGAEIRIWPRSLSGDEYQTIRTLSRQGVPPRSVWFTNADRRVWYLLAGEHYAEADAKWLDKHPAVNLSEWSKVARPGDTLLMSPIDAANLLGGDFTELATISRSSNDLIERTQVDLPGRRGNYAQLLAGATTAGIAVQDDGIDQYARPAAVNGAASVNYSVAGDFPLTSLFINANVKAATTDDTVTVAYSLDGGRNWQTKRNTAAIDWQDVSIALSSSELQGAKSVKIRITLLARDKYANAGLRRIQILGRTDTRRSEAGSRSILIARNDGGRETFDIVLRRQSLFLIRFAGR